MSKNTLIIGILTFSLSFTFNGLAGEGQKNGISNSRNCPVCSSYSDKSKQQKDKKPEKLKVGCFGCDRKPCSATRITWIQLYHKIIGSGDKTKLSSSNKEQTK